MAVKGKKTKRFKFTMKFDLMKVPKVDFQDESRDWLKQNKEAGKYLKELEYDLDAELDDRKWTEKKLEDDAYYAIRMAVKMFDQEVKKAKKANDPGAVRSAYRDLEKDADYGLDKWLKDLESGKADNAKALADGKKAFNKLNAINFKGAFEGPRKKALDALKPLTKANPDTKQAPKISKTLEGLKSSFEAVGKEAQSAVDFLVKSSKKTKEDDNVDQELVKFADEVLKCADVFEPFLEGCEDLTDALEEAIAATKSKDDVDTDAVDEAVGKLEKLSSLDRYAAEAVALAKKLTPRFKKIETKLK